MNMTLSLRVFVRQKFTVRRKVPMVFGSHERILAMDGDYIHVRESVDEAAANLFSFSVLLSYWAAFGPSLR